MRKLVFKLSALWLVAASLPAYGWFDGGHMIVAAIAYSKLDSKTRARVDALLKLNPMYKTWTENVAKKQKGVTAFIKAATWADCIKRAVCTPGFTSDGPGGGNEPTGTPADSQNIGYQDKLMHKYWHYVDLPYEAGAPAQPAKSPNALTEMILMRDAIGGTVSDDIKSYDVVWLAHIVGDIHQPLHSVSRFTKDHPNGDAGGNRVYFCERPCTEQLHSYWDGLLGATPSVAQAIQTGKGLVAAGKPAGTDNSSPESWVNESLELAKTAVYVAPIGDDNNPAAPISPRPDTAYEARAHRVSRQQAVLAGYRLAGLLNNNLK